MKNSFFIFISAYFLSTCGQDKKENLTNSEQINQTFTNEMDISKISNQNVRKAIEALQNNDKTAWFNHFTNDAVFTDDGRTMDFKSFFDNAFDKKEKFLTLDKIENDGKDISGNFYAGTWGTFNVYFKFHESENGKFNRLDIGQVSKLK